MDAAECASPDYCERIARAAKALAAADKIIIGGGAGLSEAADITYGGERFRSLFAPWIARYHIPDMYAGGFYPYPTEEERWAYWAHHVLANRFDAPPMPLYATLRDLVSGKDAFVITTNVESQFEKAGFPPERIFEVQGNYGLIQCAKGCHDTLYPDEELMREMGEQARDLSIPTELVPICPACGGPMDIHVRKDAFFVEDSAWREASKRYEKFVRPCTGRNTVLLELGVGYNTPSIIRFPFERMALTDPERVTLIRLNRDEPAGLRETERSTIAFTEDMATVFEDLINSMEGNRA